MSHEIDKNDELYGFFDKSKSEDIKLKNKSFTNVNVYLNKDGNYLYENQYKLYAFEKYYLITTANSNLNQLIDWDLFITSHGGSESTFISSKYHNLNQNIQYYFYNSFNTLLYAGKEMINLSLSPYYIVHNGLFQPCNYQAIDDVNKDSRAITGYKFYENNEKLDKMVNMIFQRELLQQISSPWSDQERVERCIASVSNNQIRLIPRLGMEITLEDIENKLNKYAFNISQIHIYACRTHRNKGLPYLKPRKDDFYDKNHGKYTEDGVRTSLQYFSSPDKKTISKLLKTCFNLYGNNINPNFFEIIKKRIKEKEEISLSQRWS